MKATRPESIGMKPTEQLERLQQRAPGAFEDLILEYQDRVVGTCYRFVHNRQDAEDLAQEVFLEVYQSVGGFRGQSRLSTWIYRIAVTKSLDFIRRKNRKKRLGQVKRLLGFEDQAAEVLFEASDDPGPQEILEEKERRALLYCALETLPESQKVAMLLHKMQQLSTVEVAEIMGITRVAVESLLHRGRKRLADYLMRYYHKKT